MSAEDLSVQLIYQYDHHTNIPWNIVQYQPLRDYEGKQTTPSMIGRYVTKKGFYMDQHIKNVQSLPAPDKYPTKSQFDQTLNKKQSVKYKMNPRLKKRSYLDQIQLQGKKIKIGVGTYHLQKTQKQLHQEVQKMRKYTKTSHAQRPSFYQDIQLLSSYTPGSGNYNPHLSVDHVKKQRLVPETWRKKHSKQEKQLFKKKKKIPGPTSYRPLSAGTFDCLKLDTERQKKKRGKSFNKSFGTDAKFQYCRPSKKKIIEQRPDPTRYDTSIPWKGKKDDTKKQGWKSFVSTRSNSFSIYNGP